MKNLILCPLILSFLITPNAFAAKPDIEAICTKLNPGANAGGLMLGVGNIAAIGGGLMLWKMVPEVEKEVAFRRKKIGLEQIYSNNVEIETTEAIIGREKDIIDRILKEPGLNLDRKIDAKTPSLYLSEFNKIEEKVLGSSSINGLKAREFELGKKSGDIIPGTNRMAFVEDLSEMRKNVFELQSSFDTMDALGGEMISKASVSGSISMREALQIQSRNYEKILADVAISREMKNFSDYNSARVDVNLSTSTKKLLTEFHAFEPQYREDIDLKVKMKLVVQKAIEKDLVAQKGFIPVSTGSKLEPKYVEKARAFLVENIAANIIRTGEVKENYAKTNLLATEYGEGTKRTASFKLDGQHAVVQNRKAHWEPGGGEKFTNKLDGGTLQEMKKGVRIGTGFLGVGVALIVGGMTYNKKNEISSDFEIDLSRVAEPALINKLKNGKDKCIEALKADPSLVIALQSGFSVNEGSLKNAPTTSKVTKEAQKPALKATK